jgi:Rrf2 family protein
MLLRQDRALLAIDIVLDVAFHAGRGGDVTGAAEIAERLLAHRRGIEPILQALTRAALLDSTRGPKGGYRLARAPRAIPLIEVIEAVLDVEEARPEPAGKLAAAVTAPLWTELDGALRERLAMLTIGDLLRRAAAAGLRRPQTEPLDFAI